MKNDENEANKLHPKTFRLNSVDNDRLRDLKEHLGCSEVAVIRRALRELSVHQGLEKPPRPKRAR